jgi:nucleoside-diphosphate-sugar epimerase
VVEMFGMGSDDVIYIDEIPGEARNTLCKSELAKDKLKWKPKINLKDWLEKKLDLSD